MLYLLISQALPCSISLGSTRLGLGEGSTAWIAATTTDCPDLGVELSGPNADELQLGDPVLRWAAGSAEEYWIPVTASADRIPEGPEFGRVVLSKGGTPQAVVAVEIIDDDGVSFHVICEEDGCWDEGDEGRKDVIIEVRLGQPHTERVALSFHTEDGQADSKTDYVSVNGRISLDPGVQSKRFSVSVRGDGDLEGDESFLVVFGDLVGTEYNASERLEVWILDDEGK